MLDKQNFSYNFKPQGLWATNKYVLYFWCSLPTSTHIIDYYVLDTGV